nr:phosphoglycerate mutase family protein [Colwellia maritima]
MNNTKKLNEGICSDKNSNCNHFISTELSRVAVNNYSIYLVRHAEKTNNAENPSLTSCGKRRAEMLANMLSKTNITSIYSTSYQRTMQTSKPLADLNNRPIKIYNPKQLDQLALILQQKHENTLVVGHSNTTPQLVELLTNQKIPPLTEQDFQYLYQVHFVNEQPLLTIFQLPLNCLVTLN